MARQTAAQTFDLSAVDFEEVEALPGQLRSGRTAAENPFVAKLEALDWDSPRAFTVPNGEKTREATNQMRQAAVRLSIGLKLRYSIGDDSLSYEDACQSAKPVRITFVKSVLREKQERRYTASDIRDWLRALVDAGETDFDSVKAYIEGAKLTPEIRDAYRKAHNITK